MEMFHKAVPTALKSPLSRKRPAEVPGLEQIKKKMEVREYEKI